MYTDVKIEHMLIDYTSVFGRFLLVKISKKAPTNKKKICLYIYKLCWI